MRKPGQFLMILLAMAATITAIPGNVMAKSKNNMKAQSATSLCNPAIEEDSSMESGQKVTWDCVWFGSYPQTEIVDKAETSGVYGRSWGDDSYYEVNETLYESLKNDSGWDANGDTTINGTKYRRIRSGDAAVVVGYSDGDPCFNWNSSNSYHYFRYEKIKWRILDIDGNSKALLLADQVLDTLEAGLRDNRWEESIFRGWLNSEDDFLGHAFSSEEIKDIEESKLDNSSTGVYSDRYNLETTTDKVFLLASYDLYHSERSASYGFYKDDPEVEDKARKSKGSAYSIAMGSTVYKQGVPWFLRSPGTPDSGFDNMQAVIEISGELNESYYPRYKSEAPGVRPALMLDMSNTDAAEYAGTVCSDGTVDEKDPKKEDEQEPTIITAPTAREGLIYNGSEQALVTCNPTSGTTVYYALGKDENTEPEEDAYTTTIPTGKDIKKYYVWYKVVNDADNSESTPSKIVVAINSKYTIKDGYNFQNYEHRIDYGKIVKFFNPLSTTFTISETIL